MKRVGIVGMGVMGSAFLAGFAKKLPEASIIAFDVKNEKLEAAAREGRLTAARSVGEVFVQADITILCIKPQDFVAFAAALPKEAKGRPVISILAGTKIQALSTGLGTDQVARFMPNIAATKGASLVGVSFHAAATPQLRQDALAIAAALGAALEIPEKLMSAMTGVSGSGLAYVLSFVHAMAQGGVATGFDYPTALKVAVAALEGAAALLHDGTHPLELVSRITSPAGTTIQGVRALEKGGLTAAVMEAVEAAARKASEFEG
jgi:pyrroline-5-carboxylate reductase